jgi:hypothetical protein
LADVVILDTSQKLSAVIGAFMTFDVCPVVKSVY